MTVRAASTIAVMAVLTFVAAFLLLASGVVGLAWTWLAQLDPGDVIAIAAAVFAGITVYLTHRERTAEYRLRVYGEQVTACSEIADALYFYFVPAFDVLVPLTNQGRTPLNAADRDAVRRQVGIAGDHFVKAVMRKSFLLPNSVLQALNDYAMTYAALTAPDGHSEYPAELVTHSDPAVPLNNAYNRALEAMREALRVEPLDAETRRLIRPVGRQGRVADPRKEITRDGA